MLKPSLCRDPWFAFPVCFAMLLDASLTLVMQPAEYWHDASRFVEGNAAWEPLLRRGPLVFAGGFILYVTLVGLLVVWLRGTLQKFFGAFILLAHSYGAASWAHTRPSESSYWWILMAVFLLEAAAFGAWWRLSTRRTVRPS